MKKLIIQFEFPDDYEHDEVLDEVTKVQSVMSDKLSFTILERK